VHGSYSVDALTDITQTKRSGPPKRIQRKALEWNVLYEKPRITLTDAYGRDRLIDELTEDRLDQA
jgi:hypothetical protein